jgi:hypothetical protein
MDNFQIGHARDDFVSEIEWIYDPDSISLNDLES